MNKQKALSGFVIALVVTLVAAGALQAQGNRSVFSWVVASRATIESGGLTVTGASTLDDAAVGDDLTVADDTVLAGDLTLTPATAITLTMNATLTPLGSYQPIRSAGTVNTSSITAGTAGDVLTLVNIANTSIVFTDTGTLKLGGNRTLGQYDTLLLVSDGTNWIEVSTTNN